MNLERIIKCTVNRLNRTLQSRVFCIKKFMDQLRAVQKIKILVSLQLQTVPHVDADSDGD